MNEIEPDGTIKITILMAGRPYLLRINATDEALVLGLVKDVNERIDNYKQAVASKDTQDALSMAFLAYVMEVAKGGPPTK